MLATHDSTPFAERTSADTTSDPVRNGCGDYCRIGSGSGKGAALNRMLTVSHTKNGSSCFHSSPA
jgi:hypothetical protein